MAQSKLEQFFAKKDKTKGNKVTVAIQRPIVTPAIDVTEFPSLRVSRTGDHNIGADDSRIIVTKPRRMCIIRSHLNLKLITKTLEKFTNAEGINPDDVIMFPLVSVYESPILQKFVGTLLPQAKEKTYLLWFKNDRHTRLACSFVHKNILAKEIPLEVRSSLLSLGQLSTSDIEKVIANYLFCPTPQEVDEGPSWIKKGICPYVHGTTWAEESDEENRIRTILLAKDPIVPRLSFFATTNMKAEELSISLSEIPIRSIEVSGDNRDYRHFIDEEEMKYGEVRRATKMVDIIMPTDPSYSRTISDMWELIILISLLGLEVEIVTEKGRRHPYQFFLEASIAQ